MQANAVYYTLVATARLNHLNIYKYFKYLFDHLPNRKDEGIEGVEAVQTECHE